MDEHEIEIWAEQHMDRLDAAYMSGKMTGREYDQRVTDLIAAVALKYRGLRGTPIVEVRE